MRILLGSSYTSTLTCTWQDHQFVSSKLLAACAFYRRMLLFEASEMTCMPSCYISTFKRAGRS